MRHTEESLCKDLDDYCRKHVLPLLSADEVQQHCVSMRDEFDDHIEWLDGYIERWDNVMSPNLPTVEHLAREFSRQLYHAIGSVGVMKVNRLNALSDDPRNCHSHDFCDANMVMRDAWCALTGVNEEDFDVTAMSQRQTDLWNEAWTLAKKQEFKQ